MDSNFLKSDAICCTETQLANNENCDIHGYTFLSNNNSHVYSGLGVYFRNRNCTLMQIFTSDGISIYNISSIFMKLCITLLILII